MRIFSRNFVSNGNWRIVVILWIQRNGEIIPTLIFSDNVVLRTTSSENNEISNALNIIFSGLTAASIFIGVYLLYRLSEIIKMTKKNQTPPEEIHEYEQEPPQNNNPPPPEAGQQP